MQNKLPHISRNGENVNFTVTYSSTGLKEKVPIPWMNTNNISLKFLSFKSKNYISTQSELQIL